MLQSFENLPLYSLFIKENLFVVVFSTHVTSYGTAVNYIPLSGYAWDPYIVKGRHCKLLAKLDYSMRQLVGCTTITVDKTRVNSRAPQQKSGLPAVLCLAVRIVYTVCTTDKV